MKRFMLKILTGFLAVLLTAGLPVYADEPTLTETPSAAENSLFYEWEPSHTAEDAQALVDFALSGGFDRIIYSLPAQDPKELTGLYPPRIHPSLQTGPFGKQPISADLSFIQQLSALCEEKDLALSCLIDPYLLSQNDPAGRFVCQLSLLDPSFARIENDTVRLDPSSLKNQTIAAYKIQKILSAAIHLDEFIFFSDSFSGPDQIAKAKELTSFVEEIGAADLSFSIYYPDVPSFANFQDQILPITLSDNRLVHKIYLTVSGDVTGQVSSFERDLFQQIQDVSQLSVIPVLDASEYPAEEQLFGVSSRIYLSQKMGYSSVAVSDYNHFSQTGASSQALFSTAFSGDLSLIPTGFSLDIPSNFAITRPESGTVNVSGSSYFITGTSDPDKPLFLDGEEVIRNTENGCFGVYLTDIPYGTSQYVFSQGSRQKTVSVYRPEPSGSVHTISRITQSSIFPTYDEAVKSGETFTVSCIAPAGAAVYAYFQGQSVQLKQVASAQYGVPARFKGQMTMKNTAPEDETEKVSPISYSMWFGGVYSSYTSEGNMFCVGEQAQLAVMANDYINNVYGDYTVEDDFYMTLYNGATDHVAEICEDHYKLSSGGYLPKSTATILEGKSNIISRISSVTYKQDERGETLRLTGTAKVPYKAEMNDSELLVTVWNCEDIPQQLGQVQSDLFDSVEPHFNDDGSVTFQFKRKKDSVLWGYNVEYDENDLLIYAKKAPVLSENASRPLDGVVIVIDAGHGGEDPGALGIAGSHGPAERELNFISAYASAQVLESMGATVHMVAPNNERLDFAGRMDPARQMRADFFISFHHNSTAETTDSRDYAGTEVYYHEDQSGLFAENLLNSITNATGRNARGAYQDYYRVTRMTYAPSVMLELGFVVNPTEYESLCRPISIYQTAMGVAQGVLQTIENAS